MSSLYNLLAEIGPILKITFNYVFFIKQYSLANEKFFCKFFKIVRRSFLF